MPASYPRPRQALEEEVELLTRQLQGATAQLQESETANDDLNLELQELQEQLLERWVLRLSREGFWGGWD